MNRRDVVLVSLSVIVLFIILAFTMPLSYMASQFYLSFYSIFFSLIPTVLIIGWIVLLLRYLQDNTRRNNDKQLLIIMTITFFLFLFMFDYVLISHFVDMGTHLFYSICFSILIIVTLRFLWMNRKKDSGIDVFSKLITLLLIIFMISSVYVNLNGIYSQQYPMYTEYVIIDSQCGVNRSFDLTFNNTGTLEIDPDEISVLDQNTGESINGDWMHPNGASFYEGEVIEVGNTAIWSSDPESCIGNCSYRVIGGTARSQVARIEC